MINDKQRAEFDQASATFADTFPPMWRRLYVKLVEENFTEDQALDILKAYIAAAHGK